MWCEFDDRIRLTFTCSSPICKLGTDTLNIAWVYPQLIFLRRNITTDILIIMKIASSHFFLVRRKFLMNIHVCSFYNEKSI